MPNKNYLKGRNFEYQVMKHFEKQGFYCIRSSGSHKVADILVYKPHKKVEVGQIIPNGEHLLIQCKTDGKISKKELKKCMDWIYKYRQSLWLASKEKVKNKSKIVFIPIEKID